MFYQMPPAPPVIIIYASECEQGSRDCFPDNRAPVYEFIKVDSEDDRGSGRKV